MESKAKSRCTCSGKNLVLRSVTDTAFILPLARCVTATSQPRRRITSTRRRQQPLVSGTSSHRQHLILFLNRELPGKERGCRSSHKERCNGGIQVADDSPVRTLFERSKNMPHFEDVFRTWQRACVKFT